MSSHTKWEYDHPTQYLVVGELYSSVIEPKKCEDFLKDELHRLLHKKFKPASTLPVDCIFHFTGNGEQTPIFKYDFISCDEMISVKFGFEFDTITQIYCSKKVLN